MSIKLASVCPVCGRPKGAVSLSEYDCAHCGFQNAYLQSFAGEESRAQWQRTVQDAQAAWRGKQRAELARAHRLTVGSHGVALWVPSTWRWPTDSSKWSSRPCSTAPPSAIALCVTPTAR